MVVADLEAGEWLFWPNADLYERPLLAISACHMRCSLPNLV